MGAFVSRHKFCPAGAFLANATLESKFIIVIWHYSKWSPEPSFLPILILYTVQELPLAWSRVLQGPSPPQLMLVEAANLDHSSVRPPVHAWLKDSHYLGSWVWHSALVMLLLLQWQTAMGPHLAALARAMPEFWAAWEESVISKPFGICLHGKPTSFSAAKTSVWPEAAILLKYRLSASAVSLTTLSFWLKLLCLFCYIFLAISFSEFHLLQPPVIAGCVSDRLWVWCCC